MTRDRRSTGIDGLDAVLEGGFLPERAYMLRGDPGTGKTILGLHYLTAADSGRGLLVAFEETAEDVRANAGTLGFDLDGADVEVLDLAPDASYFEEDRSYDLFDPDEVEGEGVAASIREAVERVDPERVFLDPLTHLRHFSPDDYRFRKEVASLVRYLTDRGATVLFSTQPTDETPDDDLEFLADGALELGHSEKGRTVEVTKFRGSDFQGGRHTLRITGEGMAVYPKLVPGSHTREFSAETVSSGVEELDSMLGGGIERGTVTVISGPSGVGKTTTGSQFAKEAAARGERSVIYMFEESVGTFLHRSRAIGVPVDEMIDSGNLRLEPVEPLAVSPDEFADMVRTEVEQRGASTVVIDGTSGYRLSLRGEERDLRRELHSLCRYCKNLGVTVILIEEIGEIMGSVEATGGNISYVADNILFLRYVELDGEIRKAAGVLKKRASDFERTLREFEITSEGLVVGDPLTGLRGVMTGTPEWTEREDG